MKKIHVLNIGYPKCGTTWLWDTLVKNNSISDFWIKENNCLISGTPVAAYCQQYIKDVSANFSVANLALDRYVIQQLSDRPQMVVSIIIREPVELLWSLYNYTKVPDIDFSGFCYRMYDSKWWTRPSLIIERWKKSFGDRFNVFWYDDLKSNNLQFYKNYCRLMGLQANNAEMLKKINITDYKNPMPPIDQDIEDLLKIESQKVLAYR